MQDLDDLFVTISGFSLLCLVCGALIKVLL
jgi:hypothetical protein